MPQFKLYSAVDSKTQTFIFLHHFRWNKASILKFYLGKYSCSALSFIKTITSNQTFFHLLKSWFLLLFIPDFDSSSWKSQDLLAQGLAFQCRKILTKFHIKGMPCYINMFSKLHQRKVNWQNTAQVNFYCFTHFINSTSPSVPRPYPYITKLHM